MNTPPSRVYGLHLMIDAYGAEPKKLDDIGLLFDTLNSLPGLIGMNKIGFPHLAKFTEEGIAGISGMIMIVESHIAIHTYSKKDYLSLDVYSCKHFDHRKVSDLIERVYRPLETEVNLVERGKKFPAENLHA